MGCHLKSFPHFPQPIWNLFHFTAAARTEGSLFRLLQKINSPEKADFLFKFHLMLLDVNGNEILRACGKFWVHLGRMILRY